LNVEVKAIRISTSSFEIPRLSRAGLFDIHYSFFPSRLPFYRQCGGQVVFSHILTVEYLLAFVNLILSFI